MIQIRRSLSGGNLDKTFLGKDLILFTLKPSRRKFTKKSERFPDYLCPDPYKYILELYFRKKVNVEIYLSCARETLNELHFKRFDEVRSRRLNPHDENVHCYHIQFKKSYKHCTRRLFKMSVVDKENNEIVYLRSHSFEIYARRRPEEEEFWNNYQSDEKKSRTRGSSQLTSNLLNSQCSCSFSRPIKFEIPCFLNQGVVMFNNYGENSGFGLKKEIEIKKENKREDVKMEKKLVLPRFKDLGVSEGNVQNPNVYFYYYDKFSNFGVEFNS